MKKSDLNPIWIDYKEWEDYKKGMYENRQDKEKIKMAHSILTSRWLKNYMKNCTNYFPIATKVNFTNKMFNPVSWLGQATCLLLVGAKAQETCRAWMMMSKEEQTRANNIAKEVIEEWRKKHEDLQ